jgi:transcription elongation factor GreA
MPVEKCYFSREGLEYYQGVIQELKARAIASGKEVGEAAGDGCDWHDNFAYEEGLRQLEKDSTRLRDLQDVLRRAEIIKVVEQSVRVSIGSTVVIEVGDELEEREITIGAWGESSPKDGLVSYSAPLAKSVIGKQEGDDGILNISGKKQDVFISEIHPASYKYRALIEKLFAANEEDDEGNGGQDEDS